MARIYVLMLGLAAAAGWLLGIVLLPLATWLAIEAVCTLAEWLYRPARASSARIA